MMIGMDALLSFATYYFAYLIRFDGDVPLSYFRAFSSTVIWIIPIKLGCLFFFRLYRGMWRYTGVYDLLNLLKAQMTSSGIICFGIIVLYRLVGFSRGVFVIDFLLGIILLGGFRLGIRQSASYFRARKLGDAASFSNLCRREF